jgi:hypothetical protein
LDSILPMSEVLTMVISSLTNAWTETINSTAFLLLVSIVQGDQE